MEKIRFWEKRRKAVKDLSDCINQMNEVYDHIINDKSNLNETKLRDFKQIYIEEISEKYKNLYTSSFGFTLLGTNTKDEMILGVLYWIVSDKFGEADTFINTLCTKLGDENISNAIKKTIDFNGYSDPEIRPNKIKMKYLKNVIAALI